MFYCICEEIYSSSLRFAPVHLSQNNKEHIVMDFYIYIFFLMDKKLSKVTFN